MIAVGAEYTATHACFAGKENDRHALQTQSPRNQQVKSAVPREIVEAAGCFKENNGPSLGLWRATGHALRHLKDAPVVQVPRQAATEITVEELVHRAQIVSGCERAIIFLHVLFTGVLRVPYSLNL